MRPVRYTQVKLQRQDPECTPCPNCIPSSAGPVKRNKHSPHFFTGSVRTRRSSPLADPSPVGGCTFSSSRLQPREPRSLTESSAGGHYELMDARALPRAEVHTLRESAHTLTYAYLYLPRAVHTCSAKKAAAEHASKSHARKPSISSACR